MKEIHYEKHPKTYTLLKLLFQQLVGTPTIGSQILSETQQSLPFVPTHQLYNYSGIILPINFKSTNPQYSNNQIVMHIQARRSFIYAIMDSLNEEMLGIFEQDLDKNYQRFKKENNKNQDNKEQDQKTDDPYLSIIGLGNDENFTKYLKEFAQPMIREGRNLIHLIEDKLSNRKMMEILLRSSRYKICPSQYTNSNNFANKTYLIILILIFGSLIFTSYLIATKKNQIEVIISEVVLCILMAFALTVLGRSIHENTRYLISSKDFTEDYSKILKSTLGNHFGLKDDPLKLIFGSSQNILDTVDILLSQDKGMTNDLAQIIIEYCYKNSSLETLSLFKKISVAFNDQQKKNNKKIKLNNEKKPENDKNDNKQEKKEDDNVAPYPLSELVITEKKRSQKTEITLSAKSAPNKEDPIATSISYQSKHPDID